MQSLGRSRFRADIHQKCNSEMGQLSSAQWEDASTTANTIPVRMITPARITVTPAAMI